MKSKNGTAPNTVAASAKTPATTATGNSAVIKTIPGKKIILNANAPAIKPKTIFAPAPILPFSLLFLIRLIGISLKFYAKDSGYGD